jgi:hypothetical protein
MARPLRIEFAGALYHITSRGNERRAIYQRARGHPLADGGQAPKAPRYTLLTCSRFYLSRVCDDAFAPGFLSLGCDIRPIRTSHPYGSRHGDRSWLESVPAPGTFGAPEIPRYPDLSNGLRSDLVVAFRHQPLVGSSQRQISSITYAWQINSGG